MSRQPPSHFQQRTSENSSFSLGGILKREGGFGKQMMRGETCGQCQRKQKSLVHKGVKALPVQTKLTIGQPGDKYEQEADRIAEQVMRVPEPQVQLQMDEDEEALQTKRIGNSMTPFVQRQIGPDEEGAISVQRKEMPEQVSTMTPELTTRIQNLRGNGQPLSKETRNFFEPRFGYDFSNVRVHSEPESTNSLSARAYTLGTDVVFNSGLYQPHTREGKQLLAHELTHVLQQQRATQIDSANVIQRQTSQKPASSTLPQPSDNRNGQTDEHKMEYQAWKTVWKILKKDFPEKTNLVNGVAYNEQLIGVEIEMSKSGDSGSIIVGRNFMGHELAYQRAEIELGLKNIEKSAPLPLTAKLTAQKGEIHIHFDFKVSVINSVWLFKVQFIKRQILYGESREWTLEKSNLG